MVREGAARMSSVPGLNVRPSTATRLPVRSPPTASATFSAMRRLRSSLMAIVDSRRRTGEAARAAVRISAIVSFGKHEPP